jgi:hypothetical protein
MDVSLTVAPDTYWQLDAVRKGFAISPICGDNGTLGQSILGLPLMNNYHIVHDRTASGGVGVIKLAKSKRPNAGSLFRPKFAHHLARL